MCSIRVFAVLMFLVAGGLPAGGTAQVCRSDGNAGGATFIGDHSYSTNISTWLQGYPVEWLRRVCFPPLGELSFDVGDGTSRSVNVHYQCSPGSCYDDMAHAMSYRWGWTLGTTGWCLTGWTWNEENTHAVYEIYACGCHAQ